MKHFYDYQVATHKIFSETNLDDPVLALAGEVGEVIELVKKDRRPKDSKYRKVMDMNRLVEEVGDVLFYLSEVCNLYDIDLEEAATNNITKLKNRYKL